VIPPEGMAMLKALGLTILTMFLLTVVATVASLV
jgi:hypothetical protein